MVLHFHSVGLLFIVFLAVVQSQQDIVYISPDPETTPCAVELHCKTLSQYASQSSGRNSSEITLHFLPGDHYLTRVLIASELASFTMLRASNTSRAVIKISCLQHSYFKFSSIESVHMSDLQLEGCFGNTVVSVTNFFLSTSLISAKQIDNNLEVEDITSEKDNSEIAFSIVDSDVIISDSNFTNSIDGALILTNSTVTINRCNFTYYGGGIYVQINSIVSITNSTFDNNIAQFGGGIVVDANNTVSINSSTFHNNSANLYGGGIVVNNNNNVSIANSTFESNSADNYGGGVFVNTNNNVFITKSTFDSNIAAYGGGLHVHTNNTVSITNSTFYDNSAAFGGGVDGHTNNTISIINSTFENNNADKYGGGSSASHNNTVTIYNSTFKNNSAIYGGGGYMDTSNTVSITNSIFYKNSAHQEGGGIFVLSDNTVSIILNCTFDGNSAFLGGGVDVHTDNTVSVTNSIFKSNSANRYGGSIFVDTNNNISIANSTFDNNSANQHGGVFVEMKSTNSVDKYGGGIFVNINNNVSTANCTFYNNSADKGGGVYVESDNVISFANSTFHNNIAIKNGGGVYADFNNIVSITKSTFANDCAAHGGGVDLHTNNTVSISNSAFNDNSAYQSGGGGGMYAENIVSITNTTFNGNNANKSGGSILIDHSNTVSIINITVNDNYADGGGGIFMWMNNAVSITNSILQNNSAHREGGGIYTEINNNVSINNSTFNNNNAEQFGAGILVNTNNTLFIINSTFDNNSGNQYGGGVLALTNNTVFVSNSTFGSNIAGFGGGILMVTDNNLSITLSTFEENLSDQYGGGVTVLTNNTASITNSIFNNNIANLSGGGVYVETNSILIVTNCTFENNSADGGGGVFVNTNSTVSFIDSTFDNNNADYRGIVYVAYSKVEFKGNTRIRKNQGIQSILHLVQSSVSFFGDTSIEHNNGSIFALSSNISFHGRTKLYQNSQPRNSSFQGLITTLRSNISLTGNVEILYNTADNGAISVIESNMYLYGNIFIGYNNARVSGGGIYAYLSQVDFKAMNCTMKGNTAIGEGGGVHAVGSTVSLSKGSLLITENMANLGGGMCLEMNTKLMIFTEVSSIRNSLKFTHNIAQLKGGALYVADNTLSGTCAGNNKPSAINECFFQALALYSSSLYWKNSFPMKDTVFYNNTANEGETLYGGLLDRCSISPFVEGYYVRKYKDSIGSDYFQDVIEDFNNNSVTSDPVRVCFCSENKPICNNLSQEIHVQKGHTVNLSVVPVDQVERPVSRDSGVIIHAFLSNAPQGSGFKDGQTSQHQNINSSCTQLQYNIISQQSSEELVLYAEGPCKDVGISKLKISIEFLNCTCPDGFIPSPSNNRCSCDCNPKLFKPQHYITNCSSIHSTLLRSGTSWISFISNHTLSISNMPSAGYVVTLYCPYDYCQPADQRIFIDVSMVNGSDAQCAFNRSGKLCGSCEGGLSHSLGSSKCMYCTNTWLALLLPFSFAGIVLVAFILMLNLTVAFGTINGLIFYANIIAANQAIFLPFNKTNILSVFIAWLNLDLGIETCFYNGMDAYAKMWLQFLFPAYIILLIFVIIMICSWSKGFANLIGSMNPVATLATLLLLSYTKLLRLTFTVLNFTYLNHLHDGSKELVWLYDANVPYLKGKHIPLFVASIVIIVMIVIYTFLLLFWQWLQHCSNWRVLRWMNNTKLKALMDAYHAPYQPKHRYWTGLLLLARVVLYLISTLNFSSDTSVNLYSVSCVLIVLLFLKLVCTRNKIYKNWTLDTLDSSFLLNLLLFAITTFYLLYLRAMNAELNQRSLQVSLAYTSVSISFVIFLTLLAYHSYTALFKKKRLCNLNVYLAKSYSTSNNRSSHTSSYETSDEDEFVELRKELVDIVTDSPNTDDYRQLEADTRKARAMEKRKARENKKEVTQTVVEIPQSEIPLSLQIRDSPTQPSLQIADSPNVECSPLQHSLQSRDSPNKTFPPQPSSEDECHLQKNFII